MANLYVERLPDKSYAVKERGNPKPIAWGRTQEEAIEAAHKLRPGVKLDIERVRDTDQGGRDKWRSE